MQLRGLVGVSGQNVCMQAAVTRLGWSLSALEAAGLVLGCVHCGQWCRNILARNRDHFYLHLLCDHHCAKETCPKAGYFWGNDGGLDRIWYPKHSQGSSWTWQSNMHKSVWAAEASPGVSTRASIRPGDFVTALGTQKEGKWRW